RPSPPPGGARVQDADLRTVYRVPDDLPEPLLRILAEAYGARPGDSIIALPGRPSPTSLVRYFGPADSGALAAIAPCLIHVSGPLPRLPAPRPPGRWDRCPPPLGRDR